MEKRKKRSGVEPTDGVLNDTKKRALVVSGKAALPITKHLVRPLEVRTVAFSSDLLKAVIGKSKFKHRPLTHKTDGTQRVHLLITRGNSIDPIAEFRFYILIDELAIILERLERGRVQENAPWQIIKS